MATTWIEISCDVPEELSELLSDFLSGLSGNGVCIENLKVDAFSPSEIKHAATMSVKAYFDANADIPTLTATINSYLEQLTADHPGVLVPPATVTTVRDEDWSSSWKTHFKPLRVGRRLLIEPTWEQAARHADDLVLRIDPGMAFGTGGHETTRLCLELLERIMDDMPLMMSPSVLDLGTGSGILAMAAVKLGAGTVCAVDIDPQAVEVARENLALNDLSDQVECSTAPLESLAGPYDIILANILAEELVRMAAQLAARLSRDGRLVLSGILAEKEEFVRNGFAGHGLTYVETTRLGDWVALLYRVDTCP